MAIAFMDHGTLSKAGALIPINYYSTLMRITFPERSTMYQKSTVMKRAMA